MNDIKDMYGVVIVEGDTINIKGLKATIHYFTTEKNGSQLMVGTEYGEFNVRIVEKLK